MAEPKAGESLAKAAREALEGDPAGHAIEFGGRWFSFGELKAVADRLCERLRQAGAEPHASIALAPRNRPSAVAALLGLISARRNIQMLYAHQSAASLARNFARLQSSVLVADAEDWTEEVAKQLAAIGCAGIALRGMEVEIVAGCERVTRPAGRSADAVPCVEILTSGTTGPARQYPLRYEELERRFVKANVAFASEVLKDFTPPFVCYPMGNTSGLYSVLPSMLMRLPIVLVEKFSLAAWHDHLLRYRPTDTYLPPSGMQQLIDSDIPPADLACVRIMRSGMTFLPVEVQRAFEERYGVPVLISYGATEFGGVVSQMTEEMIPQWGKAKLGSVGRAYGEAKLRVVDPDSGEVLGADQPGLLEVLVPSMSPEWQRTTDIARIDEDGFVFIFGRADGAIQRGGFKILPEAIEGPLARHPAIAGVGVLAVPDERVGQVPAALLVAAEGAARLTPGELETWLRAHVPATHIPVYWHYVAAIPRTSSEKIARAQLRELYAQLAGEG
ncbi:MAG: fatty acid--CoA ligase family protein [Novosphingobium sp.]|nr:fatty acid--CoA ligase family protein [Novosphingobium sp.]